MKNKKKNQTYTAFTDKLQSLFSKWRFIVGIGVFLVLFNFFIGNYIALVATNFFSRLSQSQFTQMKKFPFFFTFKENWFLFYCILGLLSIFFAFRFVYLLRKNFIPLNQNQKGSRKFTTVEELQSQYISVPAKTDFYEGKGGFPISRYKNSIFVDDSPVNNLIIGTTRSGKGELYVLPAIDIYSRAKEFENKPSIIATDPKGELSASSMQLLKDRGYDVFVFDLLNFKGISYNPLEIVKDAYLQGDFGTAQMLANTLSYIMFHDPQAKDKTWENWSIALTNALIFAVLVDACREAEKCCETNEEKEEIYSRINLYSVTRLLIDLGQVDDEGKSSLDDYFRSRPFDDIARIQYAAVEAAQGKTKGNIYANTLSVLTKFTMESIAKMTARNTIDFKKIGFDESKPTALFLVIPDYDFSNHFLVTMFISQMYYILAKTASSTPGGKCLREVQFILDEFGNITPVPDMSSLITVCLGRNIRFTLIIQAYSQIYKGYGQEDAKTIIGNCGNQIYLLTIERDTAEQVSKLIGDETITVKSRDGDPLSLHKHFHEHIDSKPLINPNELMEFLPGESVVVRITKRTDLKGNKIIPSPVFNHNETIMKYRYEYLPDFAQNVSFNDLDLHCAHKDLTTDKILYKVQFQPNQPEPESPEFDPKSKLLDFEITDNESTNEDIDPKEKSTLADVLKEEQLSTLANLLPKYRLYPDQELSSIQISEMDAILQNAIDDDVITEEVYNKWLSMVEEN